MRIFRDKYLLAAIVIMVIRFIMNIYDIDVIPAGLTIDESANGYDAYSISETGKDMYGNSYPFIFNHHFKDYVEPMYTYLLSVVIKIFGYNIFSIRFLSALIGSATILTTYLLAKEVFNKNIAIISAIFLLLSPWHFVFSRIAVRGILVPFFTTFSLFFLFKSFKKHKYILLAGLFIGLSIYTYSIVKVFMPLMLLVFWFLYKKEFKKEMLSLVVASSVLVLVFWLPAYYFSFFTDASFRFNQISIFNMDNPIVTFFQNYLKHLVMLFTGGSAYNEKQEIYGTGIIYWGYAFLIIYAVFKMLDKKQEGRKHTLFFMVLFLISFIPSSMTNVAIPHILRSISSIPIIEILAAIGAVKIHEDVKTKKVLNIQGDNLFKIGFSCFISMSFVLLTYFYFKHYRINSKKWFDIEIKEYFSELKHSINNYKHVVIYGKEIQAYKSLIYTHLDVHPKVAHSENTESKFQWFFTKGEAINSTYSSKKDVLFYNLDERKVEFNY